MKTIAFAPLSAAAFLAIGPAVVADNTPRRRFLKDMIHVGGYAHPDKKWTLDVAASRIDSWVAAFSKARSAGVDFEVTIDHGKGAKAVVGYLLDMFRDGDRLMGVHEFIGQENIDLASRCKNVSVEIDPDFADGKGNKYGEMIVKSSVVQQPIVPGQKPFIPIAASRGDDDRVLMFAADIPQKDSLMPIDFEKLTALVGEPVTESNIVDVVQKLVEKSKAAPVDDAGDDSLDTTKGPGKRIAALSRKTTLAALAGLATKLPESVRAKLALSLAGTEDKPSTLCLARGDSDSAPADPILAALADMPDLVDVAELSKGQHLPDGKKSVGKSGKSALDNAIDAQPAAKFG